MRERCLTLFLYKEPCTHVVNRCKMHIALPTDIACILHCVTYQSLDTTFPFFIRTSKLVFKKMPSRSTILVYKGDSGDQPFHFAFISRHKHSKGTHAGTVRKRTANKMVGQAVLVSGEAVVVMGWTVSWRNGERFPEIAHRFLAATAVSQTGTANSCMATAIPHAGTAVSLTAHGMKAKWKRSETSARAVHARKPPVYRHPSHIGET